MEGVLVTTGTAARAADNPVVTLLGRLGLAGYGVVNLLLAYLTGKVALGAPESEAEAGKGGAIEHLAENRWGEVALWTIGVGLLALALWQLAEAVRSGRQGGLRRLASAGEAIAFVVLGVSAIRAAAGRGSGGSNEEQAGWTARILAAPGGPAILVAAGILLAALAVLLAGKGLTRRFADELDLRRAGPLRAPTIALGQAGYLTLGGTYAVVGGLVAVAGVRHDPDKATGLDTALSSLAEHSYGTVLLLLIALGFACFGAYCFLDARFRRG
jgi:uncharacterized membrane protein YidH (DUF202 family)